MVMQTKVPEGETPARCEYCNQPFPTSEQVALHRGLAHDGLDDRERASFEARYSDETDALRRFRLKALGVLILLYFGFLMLYVVFA